jgi:hypothetical protein
VALRAPHPSEAVLEQATAQAPLHLLIDKASPESEAPLVALLPLALRLLEKRIEGRAPRSAGKNPALGLGFGNRTVSTIKSLAAFLRAQKSLMSQALPWKAMPE